MSRLSLLALVLGPLVLAGCATPSPRTPSTWAIAGFDAAQWRGKPIRVECRAADAALAQTCGDRLAAQLAQAGANIPEGGPHAGAEAVLSVNLAQVAHGGDWGRSVSIGGGYWGGSMGGGVGITLPMGGGLSVQDQLEAQAQLLRAADGQAQWSVSVRTDTNDVRSAQIERLGAAIVGSLRESGLLAPARP